jgi:hypothetical protein
MLTFSEILYLSNCLTRAAIRRLVTQSLYTYDSRLKQCSLNKYNLKDFVEPDGSIFIAVLRSMYGLPQSGLLSNELLENGSRHMGVSKANSYLVYGRTNGDRSNSLLSSTISE